MQQQRSPSTDSALSNPSNAVGAPTDLPDLHLGRTAANTNMLRLPSADVHFRECGAGVPIVLLHANPGDSRDFDAVVPGLSRHGRVIALDWPGYGQSPAVHESRITDDFHERVLAEFLDAMKLGPAVLMGNSMGAAAAVKVALRTPSQVRALVLVSPGGFTQHSPLTRFFTRLQGSRWSLPPRRWANRYLRVRTTWTKALLERASTTQATAASLAVNRATWRLFLNRANDLRSRAAGVTVPTLMIFGRHDPAVPAARDGAAAAAAMSGAVFAALPCGHAAFAEVPELFMERVAPFLDKHMPSA